MKKIEENAANPQVGKELPGPKALFEFDYNMKKVTAYEGLGGKGDIVAVRCMPLDVEKDMLGMIMPHEGKWIFSALPGTIAGGHAFGATQAAIYLMMKAGKDTGLDPLHDMYEQGIRFDVEGKGPNIKFMLDPKAGEQLLGEARRVLGELGVPEDMIGLSQTMMDKESM